MMTWYRFYSEAIRDTKLRRIARKVGSTPAEVVGIWCIVLSFASESPQRGTLLLSDGIPVTEDDIADIAGCSVSETLRELCSIGMVTVLDGMIAVTNWDKRQFGSDCSTLRVQKHRAKHDVTFQKRYNDVAVTPPDYRLQTTDSEDEYLSITAIDVPAPQVTQSSVSLSESAKAWESNIGIISEGVGQALKELTDEYPPDWVPAAIVTARGKDKPLLYVRKVLRNWRNGDGAPMPNGNGASKPARKLPPGYKLPPLPDTWAP